MAFSVGNAHVASIRTLNRPIEARRIALSVHFAQGMHMKRA